ncbi:MAG: lactate dehydrogenase, partial [Lachnospiraceae bacterium]|nr:lactate dehydrogenase [Lachnospiraceae bacterium]
MKIFAYEVREDEKRFLMDRAAEMGIILEQSGEIPSLDNADDTKGCVGVTILGQGKINEALLKVWHENGVRYLSTRTIGYDHIDIACAKALGIRVCNASYAPNGVADFTVMLMLMCLRNYKQAMWRGQVNDFSLKGLQGKEIRNMTVGIMGTGRIGQQVMKNLSGFGCRMICYDVRQNDTAASLGNYVSLDTLLQESDIITLHLPLLDSTYHIINDETVKKMKDGVVLINCARGELMDIETLVKGIETEKIGALGIDTLEGDETIIHADHRVDI